MFKKDSLILGIIYGTLIPILFFGLTRLIILLGGFMFTDNLVYILCLGVNAIIFRMALKKEKDNIGRGMLLVTFIYAFIFFYFNFQG
ncbi:MAG: hypothetical protein ACJATA_000720 [Sphingobacteriales bacterium]|jgi:hypothetical protein